MNGPAGTPRWGLLSRHALRWRTAVESRKSAVTYRSGGANCERRLSLPPSPRRPSFRFSSPLIEPGVRISRTRLSDGFHVKACARAERTARAAASTPAWPSRRAPVGASGFVRELLAWPVWGLKIAAAARPEVRQVGEAT